MLAADDEAIKAIREQIEAEYATAAELKRQNDIAEKSLKALERTRTTENLRNQLWLEIAEQAANLVQQFPELLYQVSGFSEKLEEYGEAIEVLGSRLDRVEYGIMLLLSGRGNGNKAKAESLIKDIELDRQKRLMEELYATLHDLEMQKAKLLGLGQSIDDLNLRISSAKKEMIRVKEYLHELGYQID